MVFVSDLLPAVDTPDDKWHVLQLVLVFNSIVGTGFLLSSLSVGSRWGVGVGFQAVFTAICHLVYSLWLLTWVKRREVRHADFLGGVAVMMNVLLVQTALLWSNFASGFATDGAGGVDGNNIGCIAPGAAERAVSGFATVNAFAHVALTSLVYSWRQDLMLSCESDEYSQIHGKPPSHGSGDHEMGFEAGCSLHSNSTASASRQTTRGGAGLAVIGRSGSDGKHMARREGQEFGRGGAAADDDDNFSIGGNDDDEEGL